MAVLKQWRGLLRAKGLGKKNPAWTRGLRDPILPAISYFLTLSEVPGFQGKLEDFVNRCNKPTTSNQPNVQWASFCAELGAIRLLGCELGLEIVGFEKKSPRLESGSKTCDVVALWQNSRVFFEVKRKSSEDIQAVPRSVWEPVEAEAAPYYVAMELEQAGRATEFNLDSLRADVRRHLKKCQRLKQKGYPCLEDRPCSFRTQGLRIHFFNKDVLRGEHLDPDEPEDVCAFLLGPAPDVRDGNPKQPMVEQAASKGADYLLCRVPESLPKLLEPCFEELFQQSTRTYATRDERLKNLTGVILFNRFDSFVIVNRESADSSLRLEA